MIFSPRVPLACLLVSTGRSDHQFLIAPGDDPSNLKESEVNPLYVSCSTRKSVLKFLRKRDKVQREEACVLKKKTGCEWKKDTDRVGSDGKCEETKCIAHKDGHEDCDEAYQREGIFNSAVKCVYIQNKCLTATEAKEISTEETHHDGEVISRTNSLASLPEHSPDGIKRMNAGNEDEHQHQLLVGAEPTLRWDQVVSLRELALPKQEDKYKCFGYWAQKCPRSLPRQSGELPCPKDLPECSDWSNCPRASYLKVTKEEFLEALEGLEKKVGEVIWKGYSHSRFPGQQLPHDQEAISYEMMVTFGFREEYKNFSVEVCWPGSYRKFYIEKNNVVPPEPFYDMVMEFAMTKFAGMIRPATRYASEGIGLYQL